MAENDVASGLVVLFVANLRKRPNGFATGYNRQLAQRATSTVSSQMVGGIGSPCFFKLSR